MIILDGKKEAENLKIKLTAQIAKIKESDLAELTLAIIRPTNDMSSLSYLKGRQKMASAVGIKIEVFEFANEPDEEELLELIEELNHDKRVHGIMVDRPFPKHIDENKINNAISYLKDVDGVGAYNAGLLAQNKKCHQPPTAVACMWLIKCQNLNIEGQNVVIVGRSSSVGRPLAQIFVNNNATVTVCHSKTKNLEQITKCADILVVAIGKKEFIDEKYLNSHQIIVDVGIHYSEEGKILGDIKESAKNNAAYASPVPGGVGPITNYMLLMNLIDAYYWSK